MMLGSLKMGLNIVRMRLSVGLVCLCAAALRGQRKVAHPSVDGFVGGPEMPDAKNHMLLPCLWSLQLVLFLFIC